MAATWCGHQLNQPLGTLVGMRSSRFEQELTMAPIRVQPTRADVSVANAISRHTGRKTEKAAKFLTWGADEHILCALAAGWWLYSRRSNADERRAADHVLLTTLAASALPHLLKKLFDQERPDRRTIRGHWRGFPFPAEARMRFRQAMPSILALWLPRPAGFRLAAQSRLGRWRGSGRGNPGPPRAAPLKPSMA